MRAFLPMLVAATFLLVPALVSASQTPAASSREFAYAHSAAQTVVYEVTNAFVPEEAAGGYRLAFFAAGEGAVGRIEVDDSLAEDTPFEWYVGRAGVTHRFYAGSDPEGVCASGVARGAVEIALPEGCGLLGFRLGVSAPLQERCDGLPLSGDACRLLWWRVGAEQTTGVVRLSWLPAPSDA